MGIFNDKAASPTNSSMLVSDPASIAFMSDTEYLIAFCATAFSVTLSMFGSATIITVMLRARSLKELSNRLIFGISSMDLVVGVSMCCQPFFMRKDSGLLFAMGNVRSCEAAGFLLGYFVGLTTYNCALSIYFLLSIRYNKKEHQLKKLMEPHVHIIAIGMPTVFNVVALFTENFNPLLPVGLCDISGVYPAACAFNEQVECERGGTLAWAIVSYTQSSLPLILSIIGVVCTWLVYWTARQQMLANVRYVFSPSASMSYMDSLTPQQRKIMSIVSMQAVCYFLAFFIGFISVLVTVVLNEVYSAGIQDISELSGKPGLAAAFIVQYFVFPLNGFLNMIVWLRPRILRWKERYPEKSWFWVYRHVLSGKESLTCDSMVGVQCKEPITKPNNDERDASSSSKWWLVGSGSQGLAGPPVTLEGKYGDKEPEDKKDVTMGDQGKTQLEEKREKELVDELPSAHGS
ncbi:hypothetical protein ACA910_012402 [Epithemia clementina (nom. ined.)]